MSKLYRPSDRRLSTKLVPTFADRGCRLVSSTNPYGRVPGFIDRVICSSEVNAYGIIVTFIRHSRRAVIFLSHVISILYAGN
jgi:hypothetical protein